MLPFHEIENAFICPPVLQKVIANTGVQINAYELIKEASDKLAGKWILGRAKYLSNVSFSNQREVNIYWSAIQWNDALDIEAAPIPNCSQQDDINFFNQLMNESIEKYRELRESDELWKYCEGKQILSILPNDLGFSRQIALINSVGSFLKHEEELISNLFGDIKNYVDSVMRV